MLSNIAKGYLNKVFFKLPQLIKKKTYLTKEINKYIMKGKPFLL